VSPLDIDAPSTRLASALPETFDQRRDSSMRKLIPVLGAVVALAFFAAVSSGDSEPSTVTRSHIDPSKAATLDTHRLTPAEAKTAGLKRSGGGSELGIRYYIADVTLDNASGFTGGGQVKCPKKWNAISGFFGSDQPFVHAFFDGPVSPRQWVVLVAAALPSGGPPPVTEALVGAVCAKGLPIL
jgi:hypothetical protein